MYNSHTVGGVGKDAAAVVRQIASLAAGSPRAGAHAVAGTNSTA